MKNLKESKQQEMIDEREYYVSLIFDKERLKNRWRLLGYTPPKNKQLKLAL